MNCIIKPPDKQRGVPFENLLVGEALHDGQSLCIKTSEIESIRLADGRSLRHEGLKVIRAEVTVTWRPL